MSTSDEKLLESYLIQKDELEEKISILTRTIAEDKKIQERDELIKYGVSVEAQTRMIQSLQFTQPLQDCYSEFQRSLLENCDQDRCEIVFYMDVRSLSEEFKSFVKKNCSAVSKWKLDVDKDTGSVVGLYYFLVVSGDFIGFFFSHPIRSISHEIDPEDLISLKKELCPIQQDMDCFHTLADHFSCPYMYFVKNYVVDRQAWKCSFQIAPLAEHESESLKSRMPSHLFNNNISHLYSQSARRYAYGMQ